MYKINAGKLIIGYQAKYPNLKGKLRRKVSETRKPPGLRKKPLNVITIFHSVMLHG